jgi:hypothetical protein
MKITKDSILRYNVLKKIQSSWETKGDNHEKGITYFEHGPGRSGPGSQRLGLRFVFQRRLG